MSHLTKCAQSQLTREHCLRISWHSSVSPEEFLIYGSESNFGVKFKAEQISAPFEILASDPVPSNVCVVSHRGVNHCESFHPLLYSSGGCGVRKEIKVYMVSYLAGSGPLQFVGTQIVMLQSMYYV